MLPRATVKRARGVARRMHVALAPGESLLPGTREALEALFSKPAVEAVLAPLVPQGDAALPRAARRYLAAWDARFLHAQNYFAPATRLATRAPIVGWRNADAAPMLADALARGGRIEALTAGTTGVATPMADDLSSWMRHFREQGLAWGELAARDPRFAGFLPPPWWRHAGLQGHLRVGEVTEALGRPGPLETLLHVTREAAFSRAAALGQRSSPRPHA